MDEAGKSASIWTHKKFEIGYNENRIVDVNLTSESKTTLQPNSKLSFTYEVVWKPSSIQFVDRFNKYLDPGFFQHKVVRLVSLSVCRAFIDLDPLVLDFQLVHDGSVPRWPCQHDSTAHAEKRLRQIRQG